MIDERRDAADAGRRGRVPTPARKGARPWAISDLPSTAWRHKILIGFVTALTLGAVTVGAQFLKPRYLATAQIYIDSRGVQVVKTDITNNTADAVAFTNFVESQALLITSDKVMQLAVATKPAGPGEALNHTFEFAGLEAVSDGASPEAIEAATRAAVDTLKRQTTVRRPERTSFLDVTVSSSDAQRAADAANALAQGYLTLVASNQRQLAERATTQLQDSSITLARKVREAEQKVDSYRASHNLVGSKGSPISEAQLNDISGQMSAARGRTATAQARYDQILAAKRSSQVLSALPEALGSTTLGNLRLQDVEARRQLASLTAVLGPQHPSIRAAQAQVQNTELAIASELARIAASAKGDLERAKQDEIAITGTLEDLKRQVADASKDLIGLRNLEQEAEAARDVYQQFLGRSRETGQLANVDTTNNTIVSTAQAPRTRAFPPRLATLLVIGAVLGLALGLGLAILRDMMRPASPEAEEPKPAEPAMAETPLPEQPAPSREPPLPSEPPLPGEPPPPSGRRLPETAPALAVLGPLQEATMPGGTVDVLDLRNIGMPVFQPDAPVHQAFLDAVLDRVAKRGLRCVIVAGKNDRFERTALAVSLALAAQARGASVMLMDRDARGRSLTKAVNAAQSGSAWPTGGREVRRLYQSTVNDIGLILLPPEAKVGRIDPGTLHEAVFGTGGANDLLICDGPEDPKTQAVAFAGSLAPGLVLAVDETAFHAGIDHVADAALAPHVVGFATVAEKRRAAA